MTITLYKSANTYLAEVFDHLLALEVVDPLLASCREKHLRQKIDITSITICVNHKQHMYYMYYSSLGPSKSISSFSSPLTSARMHFVSRSTMQKYTASFFASDLDNHFHQKVHILMSITTARPHQF